MSPKSNCSSQVNVCQLVALDSQPDNFVCNYVGTRTGAGAKNLALNILNASNPSDLGGYPLMLGDKLQLVYDPFGSGTVQQIIETNAAGVVNKIWNVIDGQFAQLKEWNYNGFWLERAANDPSIPGNLKNLVNNYGMDVAALTSILKQNNAVFVELKNEPGSALDGNIWSTTNEWGINNQATQRVFAQRSVTFAGINTAHPLSDQVIYDLGPQSQDSAYGGGLKLIQNGKNTAGQSGVMAFQVTRSVTRQGLQFEVNIQEGQKFFIGNPAALLKQNPYGSNVNSSIGYLTRTKAYGGDIQLVQGNNVFIVDSLGIPHPATKAFYYYDSTNGAGGSTIMLTGALDHIDGNSEAAVYKLQLPFAYTSDVNTNQRECVPENGGSSLISHGTSPLDESINKFSTSPPIHARSGASIQKATNVASNGAFNAAITWVLGKVPTVASVGGSILTLPSDTAGGKTITRSVDNPALLPACPGL